MELFGIIFLSVLAALGVALAFLDFYRRCKARRSDYVCVYFTEDGATKPPDMVIICRTDAEQEEIIRRIGNLDNRRIYINYF